MKLNRLVPLSFGFALAMGAGCTTSSGTTASNPTTSGGAGDTGGTGTTGGSSGVSGTVVTGGATGVSSTAANTTAGGNPTTGAATTATATTGASSTGASTSATGTTGRSATTGTGAASTTTSGARDGGTGGSATSSTGGATTGGSSGLSGGASAQFICPAGATYPNPLTAMGVVNMIGPPTTGSATYFAFIEGPVWIGSLGTLFFSDNASSPMERIWELKPPSTTPSVFLDNSGSNGLALDNSDKIIITDQRNKRITRVDPVTAGTPTVVVPVGNFKPNDVIVRSDGNIYFTDPDTGFYRFSPAGVLTGPMKQVNRPNGIELSLDESALFVGDVGNKEIHKLSLMADGTVDTTSDKVFVTAMNNTVDGMCVDCAGNLYAATAGGIEVYNMATGAMLGIVPTGASSNCTFGGADRKTIYVTSSSVLKSVTLGVPGMPD